MENLDRYQESAIQSDSPDENQKSEAEEVKKQPSEAEPKEPIEEELEETQGSVQSEISHIHSSYIKSAGNDIVEFKIENLNMVEHIRELDSARQIRSLAPLDASSQKTINEWFANQATSDRDKFFAITLSIFDGLKYPDFRSVYEIILHVLGVTGTEEEQTSPFRFEIGDDELMKSLGVEIVRSDDGLEEVIQFKNKGSVTAIFDLMRRRYRNISLDLLFALKQIVEKYSYWEIRSRAAVAVAEIGRLGFHEMHRQVLEPWARDKRESVRAAVGYPLARLILDRQYRSDIDQLLAQWIHNPTKIGERCRWTVASVCKQIGLIEEDWAKALAYNKLKEVASHEDAAGAVIYSLVVLSLQGQIQNTLSFFSEWVQKSDDEDEVILARRYTIVVLTLLYLSEVFIAVANDEEGTAEAESDTDNLFHLIQKSQINKEAPWQLIISIGVKAFEFKQQNKLFDFIIRRWTTYATNNTTWPDTLGDILADIFIEVEVPRHREFIWNTLGRWQQPNQDKTIRQLATLAKSKIKKQML